MDQQQHSAINDLPRPFEGLSQIFVSATKDTMAVWMDMGRARHVKARQETTGSINASDNDEMSRCRAGSKRKQS